MRISVFIIGFLFEKISLRAGCRNEKGKCFEHPAAFLPGDMPCSITLNFTVDKISVNFLVDSEAAGEYNPKKMPENRRKNNYDDIIDIIKCDCMYITCEDI